jgi:uncharacterized protein (TIGR02594 family)
MSKLEFKIGHTDNHPWTTIAFGQLGVSEFLVSTKNRLHIVQYLESVGEAPDDSIRIPWCAAFAQWCLKQAGAVGADSSNAKDWLGWGEILDEPEYGCITVLKVIAGGDENYHVGFFLGKRDDRILLLGGNQSRKVSVALLPLHGSLSGKRYDVMGYRWPSYVPSQ